MALLRTKTVGFGSVQRVGCVRSLSRKRILIRSASLLEDSSSSYFDFDCKAEVPVKKLCGGGGDVFQCTDKSVFESLPLDVLIKIISGVNHEDLNKLFEVSNSICQAAKIAKEFHFAYATPTKVPAFKIPISPGEFHGNDESPPNSPLRKPGRRRFGKKKKAGLSDISVALFASDSEDS